MKVTRKNLSGIRAGKDLAGSLFSGQKPDCSVPLHLRGTEFQKKYGKSFVIFLMEPRSLMENRCCSCTKRGLEHMSAQAVGNAVAHNPVSVIVPCHRVLGSKGSLTGYAGGLERK